MRDPVRPALPRGPEPAAEDAYALAGVALTTDIAVAIRPATSETFAGRISVFVVFARLPNCAMYSSATRRFTACTPPGAPIDSAIWRIAFAIASALTRVAV